LVDCPFMDRTDSTSKKASAMARAEVNRRNLPIARQENIIRKDSSLRIWKIVLLYQVYQHCQGCVSPGSGVI
jgi:hypothetical protein